MSGTQTYQVELVQPHDRKARILRCTTCKRTEFAKGHWSIAVSTHGQPPQGVCIDPVPKCCGKEWSVVQLFDKRGDACLALGRVDEEIKRSGSTNGLLLQDFDEPVRLVPA